MAVEVDSEARGARHREELLAGDGLPTERAVREGAAAEDAENALAAKRVRARRDHRVLRRLQTDGTFLARGGTVAVALRST